MVLLSAFNINNIRRYYQCTLPAGTTVISTGNIISQGKAKTQKSEHKTHPLLKNL
jgi:hypothetical protein